MEAILEELRLLRAEAREAALRTEAREAALRAEAREAALRTEAREAALRAEAREAAMRMEARIFAELSAMRTGSALLSSAPSRATVGAEALAALVASHQISVAAAPDEGLSAEDLAPLASPDDLERMRACEREASLVEVVAPLLRAARGFDNGEVAAGAGEALDPCARVLVNSESIRWLDDLRAPLQARHLLKPDLFATWAPLWTGFLDADGSAVGKLAHRALQLDGCVREFYEAKRGVGALTEADFGQLVDYHSRVTGPVRGMLFNASAFWLFRSVRNLPVSLVKSEWGARGSRALVRRFFDEEPPPPLVLLLRRICRELAVVPHRLPVASGEAPAGSASAFLGAGGSARVFSVVAAGAVAEPRALKVSTTLLLAELDYEFATLRRAAAAGAPVVPVIDGSLRHFYDYGDGTYCGGGSSQALSARPRSSSAVHRHSSSGSRRTTLPSRSRRRSPRSSPTSGARCASRFPRADRPSR